MKLKQTEQLNKTLNYEQKQNQNEIRTKVKMD